MKPHDAVVVGGSFCGSYCARELARRGVETTVLEEHNQPGKFHKCSGLFSKTGLESLGLKHEPCVLNEIRGARFHAGRIEATVARSSTVALACDRQKLDEITASEAMTAGARFKFNSHAESVKKNGGGFKVALANGRTENSRVLVGADGCNSTVARSLEFPIIPARDFVLAWEAEFERCNAEKEFVHVILDVDEYGGFFAWAIPLDEGVRIGMATRNFKRLNAAKESLLRNPVVAAMQPSRKKREFNHLIPLACRTRTQNENCLLVGDAAGQVKATTGGGIVLGGKCAAIAAREIAESLQQGTPLAYENAWRAEVGGTLAAHALLRKAYNALPAETVPAMLAMAKTFGATTLASAFGDMDYLVKR